MKENEIGNVSFWDSLIFEISWSIIGTKKAFEKLVSANSKYEPPLDQTNEMACAHSKYSDHPRHPPSLIRVFAVGMKSGQRRLWSDWADAQADLSLRWVHRSFCCFCHDVAQICISWGMYCIVTARPMEAMTGVTTTPIPTGSTQVTPTPGGWSTRTIFASSWENLTLGFSTR